MDDCQAEFDRVSMAGARVSQTVQQQTSGLDWAFTDPDGNQIRLAQVAPTFGST